MKPSTIMDQAGKENHTIDWEDVTFPVRDTDWTAKGVEESSQDQKNRSPLHKQVPPTSIVVLQVASEEVTAICDK